MSKLIIEDLEITADASLDGSGIEGRWLYDEFQVFFVRDGNVIAGFTLGEEALNQLFVLLKAAINEKRKQ